MPNAIEKIVCSTPEEFLESLDNRNPVWGDHPNFWVFRGHSDDKYELVPAALRKTPEAEIGYSFTPKKGRLQTNQEQIDAEFQRIHEFYWSIDKQGVMIPGESNLLRTPAGWEKFEGNIQKEGWPIGDLLPLLAIAQHYGIHTRLLDWSDRPLVAAFFSAKGAAEDPKGEFLSVWALNLDWIINEAFPVGSDPMPVYVVTAPRATNPNLHAQGGIFTTWQLKKEDFNKSTKAEPVDVTVKNKWTAMQASLTVMVHVTLPVPESKKLLRLLNREHINSATIYPGYQGIANSLKEKELWDKRERDNYWLKP